MSILAIVIPYYKINYFEETLKSLSIQKDKRFKVYIGNDASKNDPKEIIENYSRTLNIIYKKFEDNLGSISLVQQWDRCLDLVTNEKWVIILGDDDVFSSNIVETFYRHIDEFDLVTSVVRFATYKIDDSNKIYSSLYTNPKLERSTDILFQKKRSSLSEYVFRKEKLLSVGFKNFPLAWWSDVLAVIEVSNFGNIYSINEAFVKVRISSISISGNSNFNQQKEIARLKFYSYLILRKRVNFNKNEISLLLYFASKSYLNNKKNLKFFIKISVLYFKIFYFKSYLKFIKLIFLKK